MARGVLVIMLGEFGDVCQAVGDLPTAVEAWKQAVQVLRDLGWPDLAGVGARLEQAGAPSPAADRQALAPAVTGARRQPPASSSIAVPGVPGPARS